MNLQDIYHTPDESGPDLKCVDRAELDRVVQWLEASQVSFAFTPTELTVRLIKPRKPMTIQEHNAFPNGRWS